MSGKKDIPWIEILISWGVILTCRGAVWLMQSDPPLKIMFMDIAFLSIWLLVFTAHAYAFGVFTGRCLSNIPNIVLVFAYFAYFIVSCVTSSIVFLLGSPFIAMLFGLLSDWTVNERGRAVFMAVTIIPALFYLLYAVCAHVAQNVKSAEDRSSAEDDESDDEPTEETSSFGFANLHSLKENLPVVLGTVGLWLGVLAYITLMSNSPPRTGSSMYTIFQLYLLPWCLWFGVFIAATLICRFIIFHGPLTEPIEVIPCFVIVYALASGISPLSIFPMFYSHLYSVAVRLIGYSKAPLGLGWLFRLFIPGVIIMVLLSMLFRAIMRHE